MLPLKPIMLVIFHLFRSWMVLKLARMLIQLEQMSSTGALKLLKPTLLVMHLEHFFKSSVLKLLMLLPLTTMTRTTVIVVIKKNKQQ
ncbi:zinc ion binding [Zea mays]|uniref:Zinc ion binding n=1 Tax=Zea mays TaxID=4577 RepID=A0A1D6FQ02_MAIZE|nr:zinc ion binding [Zea mays]